MIASNQNHPASMDLHPANSNLEPQWRTYLKGAVFSAPALILWGFSAVFLFPKLQTIWRDSGFENITAQRMMQVSQFLMSHGIFVAAAIILPLVLLEWRSNRWPRYRRASVDVATFLVNTAVLVLMTGMLATALLAAPALLRMR
jgi:hypothetical protein